MKKRCLSLLVSLCAFMLGQILIGQVKVLTIGDSTMADYDEQAYSGEKEKRGWGQMLPVYLNSNIKVVNAAKNGRSSKSFYYEFWGSLKDTVNPGDYVIIQFGHNDEKANGRDDKEGNLKQRGTAAWGQYRKYLTTYVSDVRARGGKPIFATPIVRCLTDSLTNTISDEGMHNLTEYASNATVMNYPDAMRSLAIELDVPLIDMTLLTKRLVESYGVDKARKIIYASNDNTHLREAGALLYSGLAAKELARLNIMTEYLQSDIDSITASRYEESLAGRLIRIFMAGDSTMANKPYTKNACDTVKGDSVQVLFPEKGWGQLLSGFFNDDVVIENYAQNGRSSRTFIEQGWWQKIMDNVHAGDYVVIQFGHNDQAKEKADRYTTPADYVKNLSRFVDDVRSKGANPIICTSVVRRRFDKNGKFEDSHGEYVALARKVAKDKKVPMIDMYEKSKKVLIEMGPEQSAALFLHLNPGESLLFPTGKTDNTHFRLQGALLMDSLFIEGLKEQNIVPLASKLK